MEQNSSTTFVADNRSFFSRRDWSSFWTAFLISFAVYFYTLAPTVTMEDCGELATAGAYLGVPHPPGYPIWTMLVWVFTKVFSFVTFRGQPNPAWSISLASAVFGALASGITAMLICRSGQDIISQLKSRTRDISESTENVFCWVGGVTGSLLFAFSPVNWSQSVIVEAYTLNSLFLALVMILAYAWIKKQSDSTLIILSFVFGVGLTNYQALLLMLPALVIIVLLRNTTLFRDFVVASIPFLCVFILIKSNNWQDIPNPTSPLDYILMAIKSVSLPPLLHPTHFTCFIYLTLNLLAIALIYYFLPNGKTVAFSILGMELGLAVYGYMPLSSETNPPMNWGYPRTFEGFIHAITRGQYERISPTDIFSMQFIHQIGAYLSDLRGQFTLLIAPLGLLPFVTWEMNLAGRKIKAINLAIPLFLLITALIVAEELILSTGIPIISSTYKSLLGFLILIQGVGVITLFTSQIDVFSSHLRNEEAPFSERLTILTVLAIIIGIFLMFEVMLAVQLAAIIAPIRQATQAIPPDQLHAAMMKGTGVLLLAIAPPALFLIAAILHRTRTELRLSIDTDSQKWIASTLCSFLVMSILFIALANPKGDIQDYFIQRVKFISSHALYAFWIGYGIIFGLTIVATFFKGRKIIVFSGIAIAALLPIIPLKENAFNREQIRIVGGAEQNGHDFGWQFGNYQLRGADAINEELSSDEEPLPNPTFPPEMGTNAVFFGGTDPGRFVPTYMIYSARVREDVFLITQNALADNTYMNVMRDLYGNQIWIPAQTDSAGAFTRYVEDVRTGKRPPNADIKIENGRVQISGAMGVMEINGVLAQLIFEHNNYKHDFYVEESYVIRWMYPYMEPHGLIMKINRDIVPKISRQRVSDDMDFWDWYTRRLTSNNKFLRDIVARKSFSKLRSAIAGLYAFANERRPEESERAFHESRLLYPLSPEANFRLAELYMSQGRTKNIRRLMSEFKKQDPGNKNVAQFMDHVNRTEKIGDRIATLEKNVKANTMSIENAFELADCYLQAGQPGTTVTILNNIIGNTNLPAFYYLNCAKLFQKINQLDGMNRALDLCTKNFPSNAPPEAYIEMARLYAQTSQMEKMAAVLEKYLKLQPGDWKAWLDLAAIQIGMKQTNSATKSLENAARSGGTLAVQAINQDQRFNNIRPKHTPANNNILNLIR
ncbi:MAG: hypothetical protein A2283_20380 [Lentisphaerae bacterium RIFOXYA12_FULL_48_11]|nr:MAG: hypothetical protein A2283_20380 [Lentisphaerae bacterium RIFOXYA12_FULL_48_11]